MRRNKTREEWRLAKTFRRDIALAVGCLAFAVGVAMMIEYMMPAPVSRLYNVHLCGRK